MYVTEELYTEVLPKLSEYLQVDEEGANRGKKGGRGGQEEFQFSEMLKSNDDNEHFDRKDIAAKVLDLLGKIGGHAHSIINNEQTRLHEKENFIKWDPERRLKFTVPLYTAKVDIYLDACLPKLVDLALNAQERDTRIAACEFMHALMIYMIGKNAT
jgi:DNA-dependent protein kinase catalytic subunit